MSTVKQLIEQGYKVRVRHIRHLRTGVFNPDINGVDDFLTRGEFKVLAPKDKFFIQMFGPAVKFGDVVESKGGFTYCQITSPTGENFVGKYVFKNKTFVKKVGFQAAVGLALKKLSETK